MHEIIKVTEHQATKPGELDGHAAFCSCGFVAKTSLSAQVAEREGQSHADYMNKKEAKTAKVSSRRSPIRFVRQYTTHAGNVFMTFQADDGRIAEINVRAGRQGVWLYTRSEAKIQAMRKLGIGVPCPNGCGKTVVAGAYIDPTMPCP